MAWYLNGQLYSEKYSQPFGVGGGAGLGNYTWGPAPTAPAAAPPAAAPAPASTAAPIPEPSLAGQTWGWPIPITAGARTIPGRPVERRLTKGDDGHFILDALVSFGWRAEIMGGYAPEDFDVFKVLVNGVVVYDITTGFTAPGVSITLYDGTQTTADPFWETIHGVGGLPAYIFHVLVNIVGLPLRNFNDQQPDAFAIEVRDNFADGTAGITLKRWFELLAGLTDDIKDKVFVAETIEDTLDSLFVVDSNTTFNRDAQAMCQLTGCDMREDNESIEIVRGVEGTTYSVDLAVPEAHLLRGPNDSAITFTRKGEQGLPSEIRAQAIASEASWKFTERPARWERGPKPTSVSTKVETIRVQAGMPVNQIQTYASRTLDRETEARDELEYKLPWADAIKVQPGDIHTVPEDDLLYTVKVTEARREANRLVSITAMKLHTAQDYQGIADIGTGLPSYVPGTAEISPFTGHIIVSGHVPTFTAPRLVLPVTGHVVVTGHRPVVTSSLLPLTISSPNAFSVPENTL